MISERLAQKYQRGREKKRTKEAEEACVCVARGVSAFTSHLASGRGRSAAAAPTQRPSEDTFTHSAAEG